jgi:hypothetical protein
LGPPEVNHLLSACWFRLWSTVQYCNQFHFGLSLTCNINNSLEIAV